MKLRAEDYEVSDILPTKAKDFIAEHHYAGGGSNTGVYFHGLFRVDEPDVLLGVAWWLPPTKNAAKASFDGDWRRVLSLSRLAIHPSVPTNGASFLIGASIRRIRDDGDWDCLLTYADSRMGHEGTIYKATNWEYMGETSPTTAWVDGEGNQVARKATKSRTVAEMKELGYEKAGRFTKHKYRMVLADPYRPENNR